MRFEVAAAVPRVTYTAAMCDLYGAGSDERALLVQLAGSAGQRGWWTAYGDVLTGSYVADEALASRIRVWEPQLVPGLLQVEQYAWAVIAAGRPGDPDDVQRRVMARMARVTQSPRRGVIRQPRPSRSRPPLARAPAHTGSGRP